MHFSKDHEWVRFEGDVATVGISKHAADALGDVVFVETPDAGKTVSKGHSFAVVESVKAASDVYAPVSGEVIEGNAALASAPETVNADPEGEGWFAKIRVADAAQLDALMARGLTQNLSLREAEERITEAGAGIRTAFSSFSPYLLGPGLPVPQPKTPC